MRVSTNEVSTLATLAADGIVNTTTRIEEVHRAIADRSFRSPGAHAARSVHDAIAGIVYASVRRAGHSAGALAAATLPEQRLSATPRGAAVQSALNAWLGDRLAEADSPLAVEMAIRVGGRDLPLDRASVAGAYPDATGRIVVFTPGLGESENTWCRRAQARGGTYATRLRDALGTTAVFVRANTGLHISDSGRALADLLERLVGIWPVEVERIDLIGHSMGGLIGRAACHAGAQRGHTWIASLGVTVTLGTPHHGAPLEQATNLAGWLLRRTPEATPFARMLESRSAGIKDLRFGAICEEDWRDGDPDALLDDRRVDVPLHDGARHYAVAATLTAAQRHPLARVLGDALVLSPSAHGIGRGGRRTGFADGAVAHVGGIDHLALLNHPVVEQRLLAWLA